jgi:flagellar motor switch protein FliG
MSGVRKAAVLLVAVGEELAKEILRALPEADVQRLTEELAELRGITPEISAEIWRSSGSFWRRRTSWCMGGWTTPAAC